MNCKPNDLAVVSHVYRDCDRWALGRVLTCVSVFFPRAGRPDLAYWVTEPPLANVDGRPFDGVADATLSPIRPHGDDEQDESAAWLPPVPASAPKQTEAA